MRAPYQYAPATARHTRNHVPGACTHRGGATERAGRDLVVHRMHVRGVEVRAIRGTLQLGALGVGLIPPVDVDHVLIAEGSGDGAVLTSPLQYTVIVAVALVHMRNPHSAHENPARTPGRSAASTRVTYHHRLLADERQCHRGVAAATPGLRQLGHGWSGNGGTRQHQQATRSNERAHDASGHTNLRSDAGRHTWGREMQGYWGRRYRRGKAANGKAGANMMIR